MKVARDAIVKLRNRRATHGQHPGLLLQRYQCERSTGDGSNPEEKRELLQAAIEAAASDDVRSLYRAAYRRWCDSLPELQRSHQLQSDGRLIVGLGAESVLETGLRLHHTFGMPILPGSALKGLAAHYCDRVWGEAETAFKKPSQDEDKAYRKWLSGEGEPPPDNYHRLLYGTTDDSGCVIFHDGWLVPDSDPRPLKLDVMTPHHPAWVDGAIPPSDFDSPNPVQFISVAGSFTIAVSWRGPEADKLVVTAWLERALECLCDALFHWGIGGKTTSGYGRFNQEAHLRAVEAKQLEERTREEAQKRQAELAQMSPLQREIRELLDHWPDQTSPQYSRLCSELQKPDGRWQNEDARKEVAQLAKEMMVKEKKWNKKGKDAERTELLQGILGES